MHSHIGEIYAVITALFWTFTALAFTSAGNKIGSLAVNFWRLIVGIFFVLLWSTLTLGTTFPLDVPLMGWVWLLTSGFIGVFLGDLFLFKAFIITGPRVALLIMTLSPPIAAFLSYFFLGETMSPIAILGMIMGLIGIGMVVISRKEKKAGEISSKKLALRYSAKGILFSLVGAVGQASGLVMSKAGLQYVDSAFYATQIRLYAGLFGFLLLISYLRRWKQIFTAAKNIKAFATLSLGAFFGPFLGISFSMLAITYANPGIVQTITSANPVLIIPFSIFLFKEKVQPIEIIGAIVAVAGVALFFV